MFSVKMKHFLQDFVRLLVDECDEHYIEPFLLNLMYLCISIHLYGTIPVLDFWSSTYQFVHL